MAKAKAAAKSSTKSDNLPPPPKTRSNTSTRMIIFAALGAMATLMSSAFFESFDVSFSDVLTRMAGGAARELEAGRYEVACLDQYPTVGTCSPPPICARIIVDDFISPKEVSVLKQMSELGMSFGSGAGGPTIFDVVSGAASQGAAFVDAYALLAKRQSTAIEAAASSASTTTPPAQIFTPLQISLYRSTTERIKSLIESELGVSGLYLTSPSFFSRITSARAHTAHDEYFHPHVDKKQYGSFAYTALIYLSEHGRDFEGGAFEFVNTATNRTESFAKPKPGRLSFFTSVKRRQGASSGVENTHSVAKVTSGVRHALTIAFTCDETKSVEGKLLKRADELIRKQNEAATARAKQVKEAKTPAAEAAATPTSSPPTLEAAAN